MQPKLEFSKSDYLIAAPVSDDINDIDYGIAIEDYDNYGKSDYLIAAIFCFVMAIVGAWFLL